jgi:hypothetical protein
VCDSWCARTPPYRCFPPRQSRQPRTETLFVTLVTEVSLISREPNLRFERISISRRFLWKSFSSFPFYTRLALLPAVCRCSRSSTLSRHSIPQFFSLLPALTWCPIFVYYQSIKRELKTRPIYECRCDKRLKTKDEESMRLTHTGRVYP